MRARSLASLVAAALLSQACTLDTKGEGAAPVAAGGSGGTLQEAGPEAPVTSCSDGMKNGTETDLDCGGSCSRCDDGKACKSPSDCKSLDCYASTCQAKVSCTNGTLDGDETDTDCGGSCTQCADGKGCKSATDCLSGYCPVDKCATPSCSDGLLNGDETDLDCGGSCAACAEGKKCKVGLDCTTAMCVSGVCAGPTCADTIKNGYESDIDCGGSECPKCAAGLACGANSDCLSAVCTLSLCAGHSCTDTVKNGDESDIDCGGSCPKCTEGEACVTPLDCESQVCKVSGCAAPTCTDAVLNGDESDVDCGGTQCAKCGAGKICKGPTDCAGGVCTNSVCQPTCNDQAKNGAETDVDCGGGTCPKCPAGKGCNLASDCVGGECSSGLCQVSCTDQAKNGNETDVDCGGGVCPACSEGKACVLGTDCLSKGCGANKCLSVSGALRAEILADYPTGYWPLDETSGATAHDISGHGRHGVFAGGPVTFAKPGPAGNAVDFGGSGWVDMTSDMSDLMPMNTGTLLAIVRLPASFSPDTGNWPGPGGAIPHIFSDRSSFRGAAIGTYQGVSGVHFWSFYTGNLVDFVSVSATADTWVFVAWVSDGTNLRGYVNDAGQSVVVHGLTAASWPRFSIANYVPLSSAPYPSMIQHVAAFATPLSPARLHTHCGIAGLCL